MSDTYQAIYDAVRSRIINGDIGAAIESSIRDCNLSHAIDCANNAVQIAVAQYERPSVLFRPNIYIDGNQWCAIYGVDVQSGVAGFGDSPSMAMLEFDREWDRHIDNDKGSKN